MLPGGPSTNAHPSEAIVFERAVQLTVSGLRGLGLRVPGLIGPDENCPAAVCAECPLAKPEHEPDGEVLSVVML